MLNVKIKRLTDTAKMPTKANDGDIGWDVYADEDFQIYPQDRYAAKTGISIAFNGGYYCRVAPKSGLAAKKGVEVLADVVDKSYRGGIIVVLHNTSTVGLTFKRGEKIAQLIFEQAEYDVEFQEVDSLDKTARGDKGFGSSGK